MPGETEDCKPELSLKAQTGFIPLGAFGTGSQATWSLASALASKGINPSSATYANEVKPC
jgi:hypothetical protein